MTTEVPESLRGHPEVAEAYQRYLANRRKADNPRLRIAACGVYNAGKSSLLNVLVGQFAEGTEAFKTGDVRVTSRISEKRAGGVIYVDTPGVDGGEEDDGTAWSGILGADCFLYAHRLRTTEFEQQEIAFLRLLKKQVQGLKDRLALVVTQIDAADDETDAANRQAAILEAFQSAAGFKPRTTFLVSARRFIKGSVEGKAGLVARSGVPELKAWVEQLSSPASQAVWRSIRQDRLETERTALLGQIQSIADAVKTDWQGRALEHEARTKAFETAAATLVVRTRHALKRIDAMS